jgi:hypothetical protein
MSFADRKAFILKERVERDIIMSPSNKGGEYACGNANDNFHLAGIFQRQHPAEICITYMLKHLIAIRNHVQKINTPTPESLRGKCHDICNYAEILHSILHEDGIA